MGSPGRGGGPAQRRRRPRAQDESEWKIITRLQRTQGRRGGQQQRQARRPAPPAMTAAGSHLHPELPPPETPPRLAAARPAPWAPPLAGGRGQVYTARRLGQAAQHEQAVSGEHVLDCQSRRENFGRRLSQVGKIFLKSPPCSLCRSFHVTGRPCEASGAACLSRGRERGGDGHHKGATA